jgi:hypothetical protein
MSNIKAHEFEESELEFLLLLFLDKQAKIKDLLHS